MTVSVTDILLALGFGIAVGLMYFGGLWLTVRALPRARRPAQVAMVSLALRMSAILMFFYVLAQWFHTWEVPVAAAVGLLLARTFLILLLGPVRRAAGARSPSRKGTS